MRRTIGTGCGVLALLVPASPAAAAIGYVTDSGAGAVTPINTTTHAAGSAIGVGASPDAVAITPNGAVAYVTNRSPGTVTPIFTRTNKAGKPITVGADPEAIAITPNGRTAYVTNYGSGTVTPINLATRTPGQTIMVGTEPRGIAITPNGRKAYVTNYGSGTVTPINLTTGTPGQAITIGGEPWGIAITPDGTRAYVADNQGGTVTPIVLNNRTVESPISVDAGPERLAIQQDGSSVLVANYGFAGSGHTATLIGTQFDNPEVTFDVGGGPADVAFPAGGTTGYVTDYGSVPPFGTIGDTVTPVNVFTGTAGTPIKVGANPWGIAFVPDQGPVAAFLTTPARARRSTAFNASGSGEPGGHVAAYLWKFGDGHALGTTRARASHVYRRPGTYRVTLTVVDANRCSRSELFTGQTAYCNADPRATVSHRVVIRRAA